MSFRCPARDTGSFAADLYSATGKGVLFWTAGCGRSFRRTIPAASLACRRKCPFPERRWPLSVHACCPPLPNVRTVECLSSSSVHRNPVPHSAHSWRCATQRARSCVRNCSAVANCCPHAEHYNHKHTTAVITRVTQQLIRCHDAAGASDYSGAS